MSDERNSKAGEGEGGAAKDAGADAPDATAAAEPTPTEDDGVSESRGAGTKGRSLRARLLRSLFVLALAGGAFVTGLFVFNYFVMPGLVHREGEVRVPDLREKSLSHAESEVTELGLTLSRAGERFDPNVPAGFIVSQDPGPGSPVRKIKMVRVVVSAGEEFSSVPMLFGESRRSAEQLLISSGLKLGRITRAPSDRVGEGLVIATDPPGESVLPRETPVSLLLSQGPGQTSYVMPDLVGLELRGARERLEGAGFVVRVPAGTGALGTIAFQYPQPGAQVARGDTIVLRSIGRLIQ